MQIILLEKIGGLGIWATSLRLKMVMHATS